MYDELTKKDIEKMKEEIEARRAAENSAEGVH